MAQKFTWSSDMMYIHDSESQESIADLHRTAVTALATCGDFGATGASIEKSC